MLVRTLGLVFMLVLSGCAALQQINSSGYLAIEVKEAIEQASEQLQKPQSNIRVSQKNGLVLLLGDTTSKELREQAYQAAVAVDGVIKVHNEITIEARPLGIVSVNDGAITSKIKAQFLNVEGLSPNQVKVVTYRGVVYLLGQVTRSEAAAATEAARKVSGVQKVVRIFDYLDN